MNRFRDDSVSEMNLRERIEAWRCDEGEIFGQNAEEVHFVDSGTLAELVGRTKNEVVSFFPDETIEQGRNSSLA